MKSKKRSNTTAGSTFMRALRGDLWDKKTNVIIASALTLLLIGVGYIISLSYAAQPGSTLNGPLVSAFPSKCLDDNANVLQAGNKVQLWDCNDTTAQNWQFYADGTVHLNNSAYCLDLVNDTKIVQLMNCNSTSSQVWHATDDHTVVNQITGLCLDDKESGLANGNTIQGAPCNGTDAQKWYFNTPLDSAFAGKCLDNQGKQMTAGNPIQLWDCNNTIAQKWTFKHGGRVHIYGSNLCLDTQNGGKTQQTLIQLGTCDVNKPSQVWQFNASTHTMVNVQAGLCLDDKYSSTANGNTVWLWQCNGTDAQKWFAPVARSTPVVTTPPPTTPPPTTPPPVTPPTTPPPATPSAKPVLVSRQIRLGANGARIKMKGVAVWGIQDKVTQGFGAGQYNNRQTIINTIKSWGANEVRFRIYSPDYYNQSFMSKAQQLKVIKDWRDATKAAGMYFHISWWDSLDAGGGWPSQYGNTFSMMTDVVNTLGKDDPMVFYEPFNEPTGAVNFDQWLTAFKATTQHFRNTLGYTGILIADTPIWSHAYSDYHMTQLEQYDAGLNGMNGKHQMIFSKHDYANEGYNNPNGGFDSGHWWNNGGNWDFNKHAAWETEFGNYNGDGSTVHYAWSLGAANWMADRVNDGTLVGATAFLYGPWYDVNAMTQGDNVTPTQWGGYVKNNFLGRIQ